MVGWKNWPYWLKSGIISFVIFTLLSLSFGIGPKYCKLEVCYTDPCPIPDACRDSTVALFLGYLVFPIERVLDIIPNLAFGLFRLLSIGVYFFLIGAIIGFVIEKIKK